MNEISWICDTKGKIRNTGYTKFLPGNLKVRDNIGDIDLYKRITLRWILREFI
jgi:hypothetical protein